MQLIEGVLGEATIHPYRTVMRATVRLARRPKRVEVFLRGFEIGFYGTERNVKTAQVSLEVVSGPRLDEVDVIGRVTLRDIDPTSGWIEPSSEMIHATVAYTVLAD